MGGLKRNLAQRLRDAAVLKGEGNDLLRAGRVQDACATYARGLEAMGSTGRVMVYRTVGRTHERTHVRALSRAGRGTVQTKSWSFCMCGCFRGVEDFRRPAMWYGHCVDVGLRR